MSGKEMIYYRIERDYRGEPFKSPVGYKMIYYRIESVICRPDPEDLAEKG